MGKGLLNIQLTSKNFTTEVRFILIDLLGNADLEVSTRIQMGGEGNSQNPNYVVLSRFFLNIVVRLCDGPCS